MKYVTSFSELLPEHSSFTGGMTVFNSIDDIDKALIALESAVDDIINKADILGITGYQRGIEQTSSRSHARSKASDAEKALPWKFRTVHGNDDDPFAPHEWDGEDEFGVPITKSERRLERQIDDIWHLPKQIDDLTKQFPKEVVPLIKKVRAAERQANIEINRVLNDEKASVRDKRVAKSYANEIKRLQHRLKRSKAAAAATLFSPDTPEWTQKHESYSPRELNGTIGQVMKDTKGAKSKPPTGDKFMKADDAIAQLDMGAAKPTSPAKDKLKHKTRLSDDAITEFNPKTQSKKKR